MGADASSTVSTPGELTPPLRPMTPLGYPRTPPSLPDLPHWLFGMGQDEALPPAMGATSANAATASADDGWGWTSVNELEDKVDRRTFFHTAGKSQGFGKAKSIENTASDNVEVGAELELLVEDVHFGNTRVRILPKDPATMPEMLKWKHDKFGEFVLECAQISFGENYLVWSAIGIRSNRLLYAMKRTGVLTLKARVVTPPSVINTDEDAELTYGTSIQGIQLIP